VSETVVVLPGDGIGTEVTAAAVAVLRAVANDVTLEEHLVGGASIDAHGVALTDEAFDRCIRADGVLLRAVGDPRFPGGSSPAPEDSLWHLRGGLGLYANLRPIRSSPSLRDASPLRAAYLEDVDLLIVRELSGGLYFGRRELSDDAAFDECVYTAAQVERIARLAFSVARRDVTSVDKANVLATSRLWRRTVDSVASDFPEVGLRHMLVDNAAVQLIANAASFDVLLTENLFGDILSDEASALTGSLGMLPSASLGEEGSPGLFEPVHGSAPDIAGTNSANPIGAIQSAAMLLRYGLNRHAEADAIESGVEHALQLGVRTRDLGGRASTTDVTHAVLAAL
jgi:3-isopropylmalate dehydrogenase